MSSFRHIAENEKENFSRCFLVTELLTAVVLSHIYARIWKILTGSLTSRHHCTLNWRLFYSFCLLLVSLTCCSFCLAELCRFSLPLVHGKGQTGEAAVTARGTAPAAGEFPAGPWAPQLAARDQRRRLPEGRSAPRTAAQPTVLRRNTVQKVAQRNLSLLINVVSVLFFLKVVWRETLSAPLLRKWSNASWL